MNQIALILALLPFYLIGAYPTGYLIAKSRGIDILKRGSGNVGAANVTRVAGRQAGIFTFLGDVLKGAVAAGLAAQISPQPFFGAAAAVAAVAGHCFSIPPRLHGGKGVATAFGAALVVSPAVSLAGLTVFLLVLAASKMISLASTSAAFAVPVAIMFTDLDDAYSYAFMAIAGIIMFRHRSNFVRIIEGTEQKVRFGKGG